MRAKGTLTTWNDEKGYGFIDPGEGGPRVFVHVSAFRDRSRRPEVGQVVTYRPGQDERGRPRAEQARRLGDRARPRRRGPRISPSVPLAAAFVGGVVVAALMNKAPWSLPAIIGVVSFVTFVIYAWDKSAARRGANRTPEIHLHLLALAGGWPGAALAQQWLRHKSRKASFRAIFWFTVVVNTGLVGWMILTLDGQLFMRAWLPDLSRLPF